MTVATVTKPYRKPRQLEVMNELLDMRLDVMRFVEADGSMSEYTQSSLDEIDAKLSELEL